MIRFIDIVFAGGIGQTDAAFSKSKIDGENRTTAESGGRTVSENRTAGEETSY